MRDERAPPARPRRAADVPPGGARAVRLRAAARRAVRVVLATVAVVSTVGFNFHVILPLLASETLHAGPEVFGLLSAAFGGGAFVGALLSAGARAGELEGAARRHRRLRVALLLLATVTSTPARGRAPVRHRRRVHALDGELQLDPPARRARPPARPRRLPVPLRLRRPRADRRTALGLARRRRRHRARVRRLRRRQPDGDRLRRPRRGNRDPAAAGGFTRPEHAQHAGLTDPEHNEAR